MPGYSPNPLATKLGIKEGMTVATIGAPKELAAWLAPIPPTGWVDVKVCAVSDVWSGLSFLRRKAKA